MTLNLIAVSFGSTFLVKPSKPYGFLSPIDLNSKPPIYMLAWVIGKAWVLAFLPPKVLGTPVIDALVSLGHRLNSISYLPVFSTSRHQ